MKSNKCIKTPAGSDEKLVTAPVRVCSPGSTARNVVNVKYPPGVKWYFLSVADNGNVARTICDLSQLYHTAIEHRTELHRGAVLNSSKSRIYSSSL